MTSSNKKKAGYWILGIFAVLLIIFGVLGTISTLPKAPESKPQPLTLDQKINNVVKDSIMLDNKSNSVQVIIARNNTHVSVGVIVPAEDEYNIQGFVKLKSNKAFSVFQKIFSDSQYDDVSYVRIAFMAKFNDQYGASYENPGLIYRISKTTAEKVKNWNIYIETESANPFIWFTNIMNTSNGDEVYVNPIIERDYYSGK